MLELYSYNGSIYSCNTRRASKSYPAWIAKLNLQTLVFHLRLHFIFNAHAAAVTEKKREREACWGRGRKRVRLLRREKLYLTWCFFNLKIVYLPRVIHRFKIGENSRLTNRRGALKKYHRCHLNFFLILLPNELFNTKYEKLIFLIKI